MAEYFGGDRRRAGRTVWRPVAPMATRRIWMGSVSVGEVAFAVGGYDGRDYLRVVEAFVAPMDSASVGSWRPCAPMACGRSTPGVAALAGVIYVAGGFESPHYLASCEAYDPGSNTWWSIAPLGSPRRDLGMAALEPFGLVLACGGYDGNSYSAAVEAYDPRSNRWMARAPLRAARQLLGVVGAGGMALACGGYDGRVASRSVEVYDPRADAWREVTPMATPRLGLGLAATAL